MGQNPAIDWPPLPGPDYATGPLPLHSLLRSVLTNPLAMWTREYFERPVVVAKSPIGTRVVVHDPDAIKRIFVDNAPNYVRDPIQHRILLRTTGRSLFTAERADWKLQRKALSPLFSPGAMAGHLRGMIEAAEALALRIHAAGDEGFDLTHEMHATALDVLARTILPELIDERLLGLARNVRRFADVAGAIRLGDLLRLPDWVPGVRSVFGGREILAVSMRTARILAKARRLSSQHACPRGLIAALEDVIDGETGEQLDPGVIRDAVRTFVGAGSDTTALALSWSLFLLVRHPSAMSDVEAELAAVIGSGPITRGALDRLTTTRAVIHEAMRLYPPVPMIVRATAGRDRIAGLDVPAGTMILVSPWVLHRHRLLWREPDRFDHTRFMPEQREVHQRFAYLPFGAGPRVCIGATFSMQETLVILATLIRSFRLELVSDRPIALRAHLTLQPDRAIRMRARKRTDVS
jgi:cytochrome P450